MGDFLCCCSISKVTVGGWPRTDLVANLSETEVRKQGNTLLLLSGPFHFDYWPCYH